MSWTPPPAAPASFEYMRNANADAVRLEWFVQACIEWVQWQYSTGAQFEVQPLDQFIRDGDLQTFSNVVSWWPKNAPVSHRVPNLADMITYVRVPDYPNPTRTFAEALGERVERVKGWMRTQRMDADNPNETREERAKRMNRERQRNFKLRHAENVDDPDLQALVLAAKNEADQLQAARTWAKNYVGVVRNKYDSAVAQAKLDKTASLDWAAQWLATQEQRVQDAKHAVDAYKNQT